VNVGGDIDTNGGDFAGRDSVTVRGDSVDARILERLDAISEKVTRIDNELSGNGHPGIFSRVHILEKTNTLQWVILALLALDSILPRVLDFIDWIGRLAR